MNKTIEDLLNRKSCKNFKSDPLKDEDINTIIECGLHAANGKGAQATRIICIKNKDLINKLREDNKKIGEFPQGYDPFYNAPVVLVVLYEKEHFTGIYDATLVMGNLMQAAFSLGLGSVWIHRAKEEFEMPYYKDLLKNIGLEGEFEAVGHCVLGYIDGHLHEDFKIKENHVFYIN